MVIGGFVIISAYGEMVAGAIAAPETVVGGFFLFLIGLIWKIPRDKKLGLAVVVLCLVAGVLLYLYD